jgi:hypothetical protein
LNVPTSFVPLAALSPRTETEDDEEHCDLCAELIPSEHRHLLEVGKRQVLCACRACSILFDRPGAGAGGRRLIPERCLFLPDFAMTDVQWDSLRVPVKMTFFSHDSSQGRTAAYYPSPMGPTESLLEAETWADLENSNPILKDMAPDVEALLVNRIGSEQQCFLLGIDRCFELVGLVRALWRGFTGCSEVWRAIDGFFTELRERAHA